MSYEMQKKQDGKYKLIKKKAEAKAKTPQEMAMCAVEERAKKEKGK